MMYLNEAYLLIGELFSCIGFCVASLFSFHNMALIFIVIAAILVLIHCLINLKERIFVATLQLTFIFFLLNQWLFQMLQGEEWWKQFDDDSVWYTLTALFLSVIAIYFGLVLASRREQLWSYSGTTYDDKEKKIRIRKCTLPFIYIFFIFEFLLEAERVIFMRGRLYTELFTEYTSHFPFIIQKLGLLFPYFIAIYLGTFPDDKKQFGKVASLYLLNGIMEMIAGPRTLFLSRLVLIVAYIIVHDYYIDEKWINKKTIIMSCVAIPLLLLAMALANYIREGVSSNKSVFNLIVEFLEGQGTSVHVITYSYQYRKAIRKISHFYSLGPIKQVFHNRIFGLVFGYIPYKSGTASAVYTGFSLLDPVSYYSLGNLYLSGRSWGSSYVAEVGLDFGYPGLLIYGSILSYLLCKMNCKIYSSSFIYSTFAFFIFQKIVMLPRGQAFNPIDFLFSVYFYLSIFAVYLLYNMLFKNADKVY